MRGWRALTASRKLRIHIKRSERVFKDFRAFALRGNVVDLAVGVIIGAAFGAIVKSLVDDVIMPPIGLAMGGVDFANKFAVLKDGTATAGPYASLADAQAAGAVTINYGLFVNHAVTFLIIVACVFLVVRMMMRLHPPAPAPAPATKACPFCATQIPIPATRCPHCTSQLQ
jgi:large conductance mechanosensitive channel